MNYVIFQTNQLIHKYASYGTNELQPTTNTKRAYTSFCCCRRFWIYRLRIINVGKKLWHSVLVWAIALYGWLGWLSSERSGTHTSATCIRQFSRIYFSRDPGYSTTEHYSRRQFQWITFGRLFAVAVIHDGYRGNIAFSFTLIGHSAIVNAFICTSNKYIRFIRVFAFWPIGFVCSVGFRGANLVREKCGWYERINWTNAMFHSCESRYTHFEIFLFKFLTSSASKTSWIWWLQSVEWFVLVFWVFKSCAALKFLIEIQNFPDFFAENFGKHWNVNRI